MALTAPQLAALKADIAADQDLAGLPQNADTAFDIARIYNAPSPTPYFVWRREVSAREIMGNGFIWPRVKTMSGAEFQVWDLMTRLDFINPSFDQVRAGIMDAFPSNPGDQTMRLAIFSHCQKQATRAERLFATGAGTTTNHSGVGPATSALTEPITPDEVAAARSLP